jgi:predicted chitinase
VACSDSSALAYDALKQTVVRAIVLDFTTPQAQDNAPQERIDAEVCAALIMAPVNFEKSKAKGKLIVTVAEAPMTEGKVFIYNGASKKIKLKFEIADTTKTKVTYQLTTTTELSGNTIHYPKAGYDTLIYNQIKEISLDSIPQGKYVIVCKAAKTEYKFTFFIRKQKLEITKEQLKNIFPGTDNARIEAVVRAINAASAEFEIGTPQRMAHFIGQIGTETGGLMKLKESSQYGPRAIVKTFGFPQYGHLFENALLDSTTYKYSYAAVNYDETSCVGDEISRGTAVFSYKNMHEIRNAYAAIKNDSLEVTINKKKTKISVYKKRSDVTGKNLELLVKDGSYNNGLLRVKNGFIRSPTLFDVTYACRMGNGTVTSKDGSTFLGKGFIHITGKAGYKEVNTEWNRLYPNDKKEFHGKDINLLETNIEVAIKASMVYWRIKNLNGLADIGNDEKSIDDVGRKINGISNKNELPNGHDTRRLYTTLAIKNIK